LRKVEGVNFFSKSIHFYKSYFQSSTDIFDLAQGQVLSAGWIVLWFFSRARGEFPHFSRALAIVFGRNQTTMDRQLGHAATIFCALQLVFP
jgi:hypothetical protein